MAARKRAGRRRTRSTTTRFEALLDYLQAQPRLRLHRLQALRRLMRRVQQAHAGGRASIDFADYQRLPGGPPGRVRPAVQHDPDQRHRFFRDPPAVGVPRARRSCRRSSRRRGAAEPIRVWSAGCASGEEAYTLAMLFAEAMGADDFRERVKIYATDVDEEALARRAPRRATRRSDMEAVPAGLREQVLRAAATPLRVPHRTCAAR